MWEESSRRLIEDYRALHAFPEVGWGEYRTTAYIIAELATLGCELRYGPDIHGFERMGLLQSQQNRLQLESAIAAGADQFVLEAIKNNHTGVIADWYGAEPGPYVCLRVDIDANVGCESASEDHQPAREGFASRIQGVHHNCGHDAHTAIGLEVARYMSSIGGPKKGRFRLIFQPAEEGLRGAQSLVDRGAVDGVDYLYGFHLGIQANRTGSLIAGYMSLLASEKYDVSFRGESTHAGISPEKGRNSLLAMATAILQCLSISRHGAADTRVNVGSAHASSARNAIPDYASFEAEIRSDTNAGLAHMRDRFEAIIDGVAVIYGVVPEVETVGYAPAASSDRCLIQEFVDNARHLTSESSVIDSCNFQASDDISVFMNAVQSKGGKALYFGVGSDLSGDHHTSTFTIDPEAMEFAFDATRAILDYRFGLSNGAGLN